VGVLDDDKGVLPGVWGLPPAGPAGSRGEPLVGS
jgi:hypothetical protein